ncbi:MAG: hypothetical protein GTN62_15185 [Gemmatimonadales bacterium]|nr:hypothetical protein [Gemmatimonadales bacterium]NIN13155.1 hypothetical protein [Gemmatimonadales bacterium]NIN51433.1 hypothetical protein [Gemmatimonadales bacterium]NIP08897.1 hypothetical protein [Gemmatimonadales bacterium]NIR03685.1 hypothetical protein [Gemmatimonadales bacterium]
MPDYTPLGIQKIARQAARDLTTIRCPRDSVVMRILASRAERQDREGLTRRTFQRAPTQGAWRVTELDVECPACRRRALGIRPAVASEPTDGASRVTV